MSAEKNWQFELEKNISNKVSLVKLKRVKRADCNWLAGGRWFEDLCVSVRYCQGTYRRKKQY